MQAKSPALTGLAVRIQEGSVAEQSLDARPHAASCHARPQATARLLARRLAAPRLTQHAAAAEKRHAGPRPIDGDPALDHLDALAKLAAHANGVAKLGWDDEP